MKNLLSRSGLMAMLVLTLCPTITALYAQIDATETPHVPNELLVMLEPGVTGEKFFFGAQR
jgi:hypothetical protein